MYLNADECAALLHVKRRTFLEYYSVMPDFPRPYVISRKNKLWPKLEVNEFVRRRKAKA